MTRDIFLLLVALLLAVVAAIIDVQHHRIPNWLTYPGIVLGLAMRGILFGWKGLLSAVAGCLLAGIGLGLTNTTVTNTTTGLRLRAQFRALAQAWS